MRFTATLAAFTVVAIQALAVHAPEAAAQDGTFNIPDCAGLLDWAAHNEAKQPYYLTPRIKVQSVFGPEISGPVFGIPTVRWTPDQAGEVMAAQKACAQELRKTKKPAEQKTLNSINVRLVLTRLVAIAKNREAVEQVSQELLAAPASPALRDVLAAMEPPAYRLGRGLRQIEDPATQKNLTLLARGLAQIPEEAAADVLATLVAHQEGAALDRLTELQDQVEAAPANAEGLVRIAGLRLDARELAGLDGQDSLSEIERLADERTQAIVEALGEGPAAAPIRLPACPALADWAAGLDLRDAEGYGTGWVYAAMKDGSLVPVFDKSLADWMEADFDLFDRSRDICQAQALTAPKDSELGQKVAGSSRALQQLSQILRANQATFVAYTQGAAVLDAQRAEIEALPIAPESLARLDELMAEPALKQLPQRQYTAHLQAIQAKRQELGIGIRRQDAQVVLGKIAELPVATQSLADLAGLRMQLLGLVNTPEEQTAYEQGVAERRAELGAGLLDAATAKLDHYDATVEGLTSIQSEHRAIVQQLRGVVADEAMQSYVAAYEAALARVADGALADYRDYLADLPDSQDGLDALEQSRYDILGPGATPPALKPYAEALEARHGEIYAVVSVERLEFARAEIAKIPATAEGLAILAEADREIDVWDIPDAEKATVLDYVETRRGEIGAELLAQPLADLDDFDE